VLKSSAHPWYFSLNPTAAAALLTASGREQLLAADKPAAKPAEKPAVRPAEKPSPQLPH
jgi:hypothetical protein